MTVLGATTLVGRTLAVVPLGAQTADSTRRWSLFGGSIRAQGTTAQYFPVRAPRQNRAFLETRVGLEFGRAFVQMKLQVPVASEGMGRAPVSVGFRF